MKKTIKISWLITDRGNYADRAVRQWNSSKLWQKPKPEVRRFAATMCNVCQENFELRHFCRFYVEVEVILRWVRRIMIRYSRMCVPPHSFNRIERVLLLIPLSQLDNNKRPILHSKCGIGGGMGSPNRGNRLEIGGFGNYLLTTAFWNCGQSFVSGTSILFFCFEHLRSDDLGPLLSVARH